MFARRRESLLGWVVELVLGVAGAVVFWESLVRGGFSPLYSFLAGLAALALMGCMSWHARRAVRAIRRQRRQAETRRKREGAGQVPGGGGAERRA